MKTTWRIIRWILIITGILALVFAPVLLKTDWRITLVVVGIYLAIIEFKLPIEWPSKESVITDLDSDPRFHQLELEEDLDNHGSE